MTKEQISEFNQSRLDDFVKVLTYNTVSKIKYHYKCNYNLYYSAPRTWKMWTQGLIPYDNGLHYKAIITFNKCSLKSSQVKAIFGNYPHKHGTQGQWVPYGKLLKEAESEGRLKILQKGKYTAKGKPYHFSKHYLLPKDLIQGIFSDENLFKTVLNRNSSYYTDRQRHLICTQILKMKDGFKYKSKIDPEAVAEYEAYKKDWEETFGEKISSYAKPDDAKPDDAKPDDDDVDFDFESDEFNFDDYKERYSNERISND